MVLSWLRNHLQKVSMLISKMYSTLFLAIKLPEILQKQWTIYKFKCEIKWSTLYKSAWRGHSNKVLAFYCSWLCSCDIDSTCFKCFNPQTFTFIQNVLWHLHKYWNNQITWIWIVMKRVYTFKHWKSHESNWDHIDK